MKARIAATIFILFFARTASAAVVMSEIMYNPQGADTGHEWVEIVNQDSSAVDLSQCKFLEIGTTTSNHGLTVVQGGTSLSAGSYAIIADNAQTFLTDHPGFSGTVLDSSFSLSNTGETIGFKMPDDTISDTVAYTKDTGAYEDGNALAKSGTTWAGAAPTPGVANAGSTTPPPPPPIETTTTTQTQPAAALVPVEPQIFADAGVRSRTVSVGGTTLFSGRVWGLKKEPIENARMTWAFGDGAFLDGASVNHIYYYPGEYTVVLDAASGYYAASDRVRVIAVAPTLALKSGGDAVRSYVAIENTGTSELDLSGWQIVSGIQKFVLPKNTFIGAHKTLTIPSEISALSTPDGVVAILYFPNGAVVPSSAAVPLITPPIPTSENRSVAPLPQRAVSESPSSQAASVVSAVTEESNTLGGGGSKSSPWMWYSGIAFLGALGALGVRMSRKAQGESASPADEFEIMEEEDEE